ncbi:nmy-3 [Pristionchus pacificus]|uniref:Hum-9 n=1 Tax=Pristionchus pacificus TaxID=54126 RepID=A0A2A6BDU9_PRIPA|nr:nmy-3 [Pristionchus pacificus]|eukprot:PDM64067.1 hum-9 [Pristionchus pacificus]
MIPHCSSRDLLIQSQMSWRRSQCNGGPSTSNQHTNNSIELLRIPENELENEMKVIPLKRQIWIKDEGEGYRLADLLDTVVDDVIVAIHNEKGIYERRRIPSSLCLLPSPEFFSEDLCDLSQPNAATILHSLSKRFDRSLIHTNCGLFCIVLNPWRNIDLYSSSIRSLYRLGINGNPPPHVYNIAQSAVNGIQCRGKSQSILITGESGSGKTENTKRIIEYIVERRGIKKNAQSESKVLQFTQLLEAFGNAKTIHNENSSRFGKFIRLFLAKDGDLKRAQVECYLLEKSRVVAQEKGERGFHIFYQLLSSALPSNMKKHLHLVCPRYKYLNENLSTSIDDSREMHLTNRHLIDLGIDEASRLRVYDIVAACLLIGEIDFTERMGMDISFVRDREKLNWSAELIGVKSVALESALTNPEMEVNGKSVKKNQNLAKTQTAAGGLSKLLYERLFKWILQKCNDAINSSSEGENDGEYIGVLDMAGFEMMMINSFEQLCINYTNERLQQLFNHYMFVKERKEYEDEGIEWNCENYALDLEGTISLCDQNLGIFSLLEEECVVPNGQESRFLDKMLDKHKTHPSLIRVKHSQKSTVIKHFAVSHYAGQVDYNVDRWLEKNKDTVDRSVIDMLSTSIHPLVRELVAAEEVSSTLPRNGNRRPSMRAPSCNTVSFIYRQQLSSLVSLLENSQSHFIRCILPNRERLPLKIDRPLVLHQLRCNGVLEGVRICRKGFPTKLPFDQFISRYRFLSTQSMRLNWKGREAALCLCEEILRSEQDSYRIGKSRVLFRVGVIAKLENQRSLRISKLISGLQSNIKWYFAQKRLNKLEEERDSLVTIHHNVRLFSQLSNWEWFRLWSRVRPFINIERTKEKLEEAEKTIEILNIEISEKNRDNRKLIETMEDLRDKLDESRLNEQKAGQKANEALIKLRMEKKEMEDEMKDGEDMMAMLEKRFADQHAKVVKMNDHLREYERKAEILELEKTELEKEVKRLTALLEKEVTERKIIEKEYVELISRFDQLEGIQERLHEERNNLQIELTKCQVEREELIERLKRQTDSINELQRNIADMSSRVGRADGLVNEEKKKRRKVEGMIEEMKEIITDREGRITKLKEKCDKMKEVGREGERTIKRLEKKLEEKEEVMKECLEQLKSAHKQKVSELNEIVDDLKRKNSTLEREKASRSMTDSIFERESSIDSDYGASSGFTLRRSSSRLLSRQASFSSMSVSSMGSLRTLSRRMTEPMPEVPPPLMRSPSALIETERKVADLERLNQNLTTDIGLARREIEVYKMTISTIEGEKNQAVKQVKNAVIRSDEAERKLQIEEGKISSLETRLEKSQADVEEWRRRWDEGNNGHSEEINSMRKKLMQKIDTLEDEKRKAEHRCGMAERANEDFRKDIDRLSIQLEKFKDKLEQADKCTNSHTVVGENWQARCYEAESELQSERDDNGILKGKIQRLYRQIALLTQDDDTSHMVSHMETKIDNRD